MYKALLSGEGFSLLKMKCSHQIFPVFKTKSTSENGGSEELREMSATCQDLPLDTETAEAASSTPSQSTSSSSSSIPENGDAGKAVTESEQNSDSSAGSSKQAQHTGHRKKRGKHKKVKKHSLPSCKKTGGNDTELDDDWVIIGN